MFHVTDATPAALAAHAPLVTELKGALGVAYDILGPSPSDSALYQTIDELLQPMIAASRPADDGLCR